MHKNWHNLPFIANDLISPSCQITPQTQEPLLVQKKGSYTRVFTLLRLLLAGVQVFLSLHSLPFGKKNHSTKRSVLIPFKHPVSWLLIGPCILYT